MHDRILFDTIPTASCSRKPRDADLRTEAGITEFAEQVFRTSTMPPFRSQSWQNSVEGCLSGVGCAAANLQFYRCAYGEAAPCDFTPLSFGSIRQEPLEAIWRRMIGHPAYAPRTSCCRMQNPQFRRRCIDPISEGALLPYPIDKLLGAEPAAVGELDRRSAVL